MRPRLLTAAECLTCRTPLHLLAPSEQSRIAEHRMNHRREDRRRAQYRAYAERRAIKRRAGVYGWLHDLSCNGKHVTRRRGCTPIPVYREEVA